MPFETGNLKLKKVQATLEKIQKSIYTPLAELTVTAWRTKEPVSFAERYTGEQMELAAGDKWGELWDCAWFRFTGQLSEAAAKDKKIVFLIDVNGELCLVDQQGVPTQGLTNVNSEFDLTLGLPGKRVVESTLYTDSEGKIELWADAGCNDLFGYYRSGTLKEATIAICNEEAYQLYYDVEVLAELAEHGAEGSRKSRVLEALYQVSLLLRNMSEANIIEARALLAPELAKRGGDPTLSISAIGHAHIDLAWLWPIRETIRKGARTFATVLRLMERYPDYVFGASQPQLYQWMKQEYPALYEQIKQRINEGRWEVQGAMWVEPDSNVSGGEALVRQILYGKRFFQKEFGKDMRVLWVPDIFGYTASLPQILKKSGVDYMMTQKLSWSVYNKHPHHTFHWEGIDGSKVLTHTPPEDTYNGPALPRSIIKVEKDYLDNGISDHALLLFGIGDGGGGPGDEHLERLKREQNLQGLAPVQQETSIEFFDKLNLKSELYKTWRGELYLEKHQGTLTTQARNKRYNRKMEKALRELEFAASLDLTFGGHMYPASELAEIWEEMLLFQFHDILPGSSITRVYDESLARYELLLAKVEELLAGFYTKAAGQIKAEKAVEQIKADNTAGQINEVVVFNSLPWQRKEWLKVADSWVYASIPSMGYQSMDLTQISKQEFNLIADKDHLENELLRVLFNLDGTIHSIYDKENQREVLPQGAKFGMLSVYDDNGDAWDFPTDYADTKATQMTLLSVNVSFDGPKAILEQEYQYQTSKLLLKVSLTAGNRMLDFAAKVDWNESEKMLRASFPVDIYTEQVNCEIQFGHIKRPTHRNTMWDYAKDEICAHHWIDLSQPDYGVALLNDCKYGFKAFENVLDINLLRSPSFPDPVADRAQHEFSYSIFPHAADYVQAEVYKQGYEMNVPLRVVPVVSVDPHAGQLEKQYSFVELSQTNIMIEAVKKAEDNEDIIIRLYETAGANSQTQLTFGKAYSAYYITDLMENNLNHLAGDTKEITLSFTPFEIKTLRLQQ